MAPEVAVSITPASNGSTAIASSRLVAGSTSNTGYKVYVRTENDNSDMSSPNPKITTRLSSLPASMVLNQATINTWGLNISKTEPTDESFFRGADSTDTVFAETTTLSPQDTYYFSLGVKADDTMLAGQYMNKLVVSVVANAENIPGLLGITYMQDMTTAVCDATVDVNGSSAITPGNEVTKQLLDARDGKAYWVAKLADQNCWMTQNLDLSLSTTKTLTNKDTDLHSVQSWTPSVNTRNGGPNAGTEQLTSNEFSWDYGDYVLAVPQKGEICNVPPAGGSTLDDGYNSVRPGQSLSQCADFQNVDGWLGNYVTQNGTWGDYSGPVSVNTAARRYDAHYLIGNYYAWQAATAGSGTKIDADVTGNTGGLTNPSQLVEAPDSICPRGWRLPTGGQNNGTGWPFDREKSFYRLLHAYGYPATGALSNNADTGWTKSVTDATAGEPYASMTAATRMARVDAAPIYMVRGGAVYMTPSSLLFAGLNGRFWFSTAIPNNAYLAYSAQISGNYAGFERGYRVQGVPVRCVAR